MRPAARIPLTTREGKDDAPIEPGARWNIEPCVAAPPAKWWRFTTPLKPLAAARADDVDAFAVLEHRDEDLIADLRIAVFRERHFPQHPGRRYVRLLVVTGERLRHLAGLLSTSPSCTDS
jgi:hypothetical protein